MCNTILGRDNILNRKRYLIQKGAFFIFIHLQKIKTIE